MQRQAALPRRTQAIRELIVILSLTFFTWFLAELSNDFVDRYALLSLLGALALLLTFVHLWNNLRHERDLRLQAEAELHARPAATLPDLTAEPTALRQLTEREREVLGLIASSCSNQQIASALCISVNTVERHSANLYRKLGVRGRVEATAYALRAGYVTRESQALCRENPDGS